MKLYLDTSVVSHLIAPGALDKQEDTRKLWEIIQAGKYEVFLSPVVIGEVEDCPEPKYSLLVEQLKSIEYTELHENAEVSALANKYIET
jgi:predicted nucleic acid-binding protein